MPGLRLLAILQTDCPTCRLITPYLNTLAANAAPVTAISQDAEDATREFVRQMDVRFPVERDPGFELSKRWQVVTVPTLYVLDEQDRIVRQEPGFDKNALNEIAALFGHAAGRDALRRRARQQAGMHVAASGSANRGRRAPRRSICIRRAARRRRSSTWPTVKIRLRILLPRIRRRAAGGAAHARSRREDAAAPPDATRAK